MKIVTAFLIALAGCMVWIVVVNARLVSPRPENGSRFLKSYTPKQVIDRFKAAEFSEVATGTSGGAGNGFATHTADFEPTLVIETKNWVALVQAVRDDITSTLIAQNARIMKESGNPVDGFTIKYAIGKSEGNVHVEPLKSMASSPQFDAAGAGANKVTVRFRIHIDEKWFKS